jgi:hypothetical protein
MDNSTVMRGQNTNSGDFPHLDEEVKAVISMVCEGNMYKKQDKLVIIGACQMYYIGPW